MSIRWFLILIAIALFPWDASVAVAQAPIAQPPKVQPPIAQQAVAQAPVAQQALAQAPAKAKPRMWEANWSWEDVQIGKLLDRLESIGVGVPIDADGKVSVDLAVSIPIGNLRASDQYRAQGLIRSQRLRVERLVLDDFAAALDLRDGVLSVERLRGKLGTPESPGQGQLSGDASLQLSPLGDLQASLSADSIEIGPLYDVYQKATQSGSTSDASGKVTGKIQFRSPVQQIAEITKWNMTADVKVTELIVGDRPAYDIATGPLKIQNGEVLARDFQLSLSQSPDDHLSLAVHAELLGRQRFNIGCIGNDVPLEQIASLFLDNQSQWAVGLMDLNVNATGELAAKQWRVDGQIASPDLQIAGVQLGLIEHEVLFDQRSLRLSPLGLDATDDTAADDTADSAVTGGLSEEGQNVVIGSVQADYVIDDTSILLQQLNADLFAGSISGSARIATQPTGQHQVDLKWRDLSPTFNTRNFSPV
ncbi:MAG: hypothetical protein HKN47_10130, partial [Pirellulaceae bacterium]|nr:hypothetical protein [Pirellulaceae bacterium]